MFRFDSTAHEYIEIATGRVLPHTTGLLKAAGLVDDTWFTDESRWRGSVVHRWTTMLDLGEIEYGDLPKIDDGKYKGYLAAHHHAMVNLRPDWVHVEEPFVHPVFLFGSRPDRLGDINGAFSNCDLKSGAPSKAHPIQTALQCIAAEPYVNLPAEGIVRYCLYLKNDGKWKLERHDNMRDFQTAREIIRRYAGVDPLPSTMFQPEGLRDYSPPDR